MKQVFHAWKVCVSMEESKISFQQWYDIGGNDWSERLKVVWTFLVLRKSQANANKQYSRSVAKLNVPLKSVTIDNFYRLPVNTYLRRSRDNPCRLPCSLSSHCLALGWARSYNVDSSRNPSDTTPEATGAPASSPDYPDVNSSDFGAKACRCCCSSRTDTTYTTRPVGAHCGAKIESNFEIYPLLP